MLLLKRIDDLRIVKDSEAISGRGLFCRIGPLAFDAQVHRDLEGPMTHRPGTIWLLALDAADEVIACASVHTDHLESDGLVEFDNAWTRPERRGEGLHGNLFTLRMQLAQDLGAVIVRGYARPTARLAFEAHGFRIARERGKWRLYERRLDDGKPL